jgi:aminopeptidase N
VRHFVANNHGKPVATADFQKSVEEISGEKFDWFFDQWVYKMGHPVFEVSKKYENGKLSVFVVQSQKTDPKDPHPQSEFFRGKIKIEIDGRIETVWLKPQTENNFTFNLPTAPKFVNFDYENSWIRELNYEQPFDELLAQFQNTKDALARQSAMFGLVRIAKDPKTSPDDKINIRNALQTKLLGNEYWRVKSGILSQFVGLDPSDENTISTLLTIIKNEKAWLKSSAIAFLGNTKDPKYADVYLNALSDDSFRVIQTAAVALGKTKDPRAFDALVKLADKPSMKSQTMLSSLAGLRELGDPRGFDVAYKALENLNLPRWRLSSIPPSWDYRDSAAALIKSLGRSEKAYPLIFERFKLSMSENDLNGIFTNILLIIALGDSRGQEAFDLLKTKYKDDASLMKTINQFEAQFKQ